MSSGNWWSFRFDLTVLGEYCFKLDTDQGLLLHIHSCFNYVGDLSDKNHLLGLLPDGVFYNNSISRNLYSFSYSLAVVHID